MLGAHSFCEEGGLVMGYIEEYKQARIDFLHKWGGQFVGSLFLTSIFWFATPHVGWLVTHTQPPVWTAMIFVAIAAALFAVRKKYRFSYGMTEMLVGMLTMKYVTSNIPANLDDEKNLMALMTGVAGAMYLMVRAWDNLWESGAILESLKLGLFRPLIVKPTIVPLEEQPRGDKAPPINVGRLYLGTIPHIAAGWHGGFLKFLDVLGDALWRTVAIIGAIALLLFGWVVFHNINGHQPVLDVTSAAVAVIAIVLLARWLGNGSIRIGCWLCLLSMVLICALFLTYYVFAEGVPLAKRLIVGAIAGILFVLSWFLLTRAEAGVRSVVDTDSESP
jgi:hypothetical protein